MKIRLCDKCKQEIKGEYVKCCKSKMVTKESGPGDPIQKLDHVGDLCLSCWEKFK